MRHHNILTRALLILSIVNLALGAPVAVWERPEVRLDADVTRNVGAMSKRMYSFDEGELPLPIVPGSDHWNSPPPSPHLTDVLAEIASTNRPPTPDSPESFPPGYPPPNLDHAPPQSPKLAEILSQIAYTNKPPTLDSAESFPPGYPPPNLNHEGGELPLPIVPGSSPWITPPASPQDLTDILSQTPSTDRPIYTLISSSEYVLPNTDHALPPEIFSQISYTDPPTPNGPESLPGSGHAPPGSTETWSQIQQDAPSSSPEIISVASSPSSSPEIVPVASSPSPSPEIIPVASSPSSPLHPSPPLPPSPHPSQPGPSQSFAQAFHDFSKGKIKRRINLFP